MNKVRTIFFGTSEFAVGVFQQVSNCDSIELTAVVTQPDRPVGRKQSMTPPLLKQYVNQNLPELQIFQPEKIKENIESILELKPELIIVADYGQMIPGEILNFPKYKCINIHGSLLPDLRGAVPIPMAILKGYKVTGVSIIIMTEGLDDGPVLAQREMLISEDDTTESLTTKLADMGGALMTETLPGWLAGSLNPKPQDSSKATTCKQSDIAKENAKINWGMPCHTIINMVNAFYPWPVAWTTITYNHRNLRLKIYKAKAHVGFHGDPGIIVLKDSSLFVTCLDGVIELLEIQVEGKNRAASKDYLYLKDVVII